MSNAMDQKHLDAQLISVHGEVAGHPAPDTHLGGAGGQSIKAKKRRGRPSLETQPYRAATEAAGHALDDTHSQLAGGSALQQNHGQKRGDTQPSVAVTNAAAGHTIRELHTTIASSGTSILIEQITRLHRGRRFAMKQQQKIDRALESWVRREFTTWNPTLPEEEREALNTETTKLINEARKGLGDPTLMSYVAANDQAREPFDGIRKETETMMRELARQLPVWSWVKEQHGAAELGLATIVAETGPLDNYPSPAHVWSRLGYAPFDGCAGSTWKRETWRPRKLTKEEWIAHPFSGERYAFLYTIADSMLRSNITSTKKSNTEFGKAKGHWGEVYIARRERNKVLHPDWSKGHSYNDALRIMMKAFLKELWIAWRDTR